jgi:hypothetical protein
MRPLLQLAAMLGNKQVRQVLVRRGGLCWGPAGSNATQRAGEAGDGGGHATFVTANHHAGQQAGEADQAGARRSLLQLPPCREKSRRG